MSKPNNEAMSKIIIDILDNNDVLAPQILELDDQSHLHAGHSGADSGGHFSVLIVSEAFADKSRIQRHRMVFELLQNYMQNGIHALNIKAFTSSEYFKD